MLERIFNPHQDLACVRTQFKYVRQRPDETAVEFIQEVQRQVKLCEFGAAADLLAFDQILTGISSPPSYNVSFSRWGRISHSREHLALHVKRSASTAHYNSFPELTSTPFLLIAFKMASLRIGLVMVMAHMWAFLPKVRGKMAPAFFLLGASPPPPVLPSLLLGGLLPPRP